VPDVEVKQRRPYFSDPNNARRAGAIGNANRAAPGDDADLTAGSEVDQLASGVSLGLDSLTRIEVRNLAKLARRTLEDLARNGPPAQRVQAAAKLADLAAARVKAARESAAESSMVAQWAAHYDAAGVARPAHLVDV